MRRRVTITLTLDDTDTDEKAVAALDDIISDVIPYTVDRIEVCTEERDLASDLAEDRW